MSEDKDAIAHDQSGADEAQPDHSRQTDRSSAPSSSTSQNGKSSPASQRSENSDSDHDDDDNDENDDGEIQEDALKTAQPQGSTPHSQPRLPDEPTPPPLPDEPLPQESQEDDGWEPVWDDANQAFYFYNRYTQVTQWENPRVPSVAAQPTNHDRIAPIPAKPKPHLQSTADEEVHPAVAGGYNPAIHGSYDPNAPYAQYAVQVEEEALAGPDAAAPGTEDYMTAANFNRFTGRFQAQEVQPNNFNDENKARRQMNAFFDVDAAANSHDGRSLKAERAGRKLTKDEVKQFRERRRERKEEKRRAWLRD